MVQYIPVSKGSGFQTFQSWSRYHRIIVIYTLCAKLINLLPFMSFIIHYICPTTLMLSKPFYLPELNKNPSSIVFPVTSVLGCEPD